MLEPFPTAADAAPSAAANLRRTGFNALAVSGGPNVVVHLQGELDMATADRLRQVLDGAMTRDADALVLDLTHLTFIDSTGIGVLVGASQRARRHGRSFVVRHAGRSVLKTLRLTGLDEQLQPMSPEHPAGQGLGVH